MTAQVGSLRNIAAIVIVALFAWAFAPAFAAPGCWPDRTRPITLLRVDDVAPKVGDIVYAASSVGLVWGYACIAPDGSWRHVVGGGPWSAFAADWLAIADQLYRGSEAELAAAWNKYATSTTIDARLQSDVDAVKARLPKPPPAPTAGSYVVMATTICAPADKDAGGRCIRRQTYVWAGGTRGAAAPERVDIGAPCDPSVGAAGFYGVLGRTDRVALCVRR